MQNSVDKAYNHSYEQGEYNEQFPETGILHGEKRALDQIFRKLPSSGRLNLLDFGCGNGRLFHYLMKLHKAKPLEIHCTCYDISQSGLKNYAQKLAADGFSEIEPGLFFKTFQKRAIYFRLIYGNVADDISTLLLPFGKFDAALLVYGVLSHIPYSAKRINLLRSLSSITKGYMIASVPGIGAKTYHSDAAKYKSLRQSRGDAGFASEGGDIYFEYEGHKVYYHLYNIAELKNEFIAAGLKIEEAGASSWYHPYDMASYRLKQFADKIISTLLTRINIEPLQNRASYLYVTGAN